MQDSQTATSGQRSAISRPAGSSSARSLRPLSFRLRRSRSGFTLTELLIVIAIIAVLAGLIAAAAINALRSARRAGILLEMKNVSAALEAFQTKYSAYPPNGVSINNAELKRMESDFVRTFKKAFPRMNQQEEQVVRALAGVNVGGPVVTNQNTTGGMRADEALYFWLGGFSADDQFPLSGPNGPSYPVADGPTLEGKPFIYEFDLGRLQPRNDEGNLDLANVRFVEYGIDLNNNGNRTDPGEQRRIDLWQYYPKGSEQPLVYFDTSRYKPLQYDPLYEVPTSPGKGIRPFKKFKEGVPASPGTKDLVFMDQKYQIIHPGLDDAWGDFAPSATSAGLGALEAYLLPGGVFIGETADTLTNFADGELADETEQ